MILHEDSQLTCEIGATAYHIVLNPDIAVAIYCGLQILAATLVSRFCSST
jgi:hypothetical protein